MSKTLSKERCPACASGSCKWWRSARASGAGRVAPRFPTRIHHARWFELNQAFASARRCSIPHPGRPFFKESR
jgi:hypothetical protein